MSVRGGPSFPSQLGRQDEFEEGVGLCYGIIPFIAAVTAVLWNFCPPLMVAFLISLVGGVIFEVFCSLVLDPRLEGKKG